MGITFEISLTETIFGLNLGNFRRYFFSKASFLSFINLCSCGVRFFDASWALRSANIFDSFCCVSDRESLACLFSISCNNPCLFNLENKAKLSPSSPNSVNQNANPDLLPYEFMKLNLLEITFCAASL